VCGSVGESTISACPCSCRKGSSVSDSALYYADWLNLQEHGYRIISPGLQAGLTIKSACSIEKCKSKTITDPLQRQRRARDPTPPPAANYRAKPAAIPLTYSNLQSPLSPSPPCGLQGQAGSSPGRGGGGSTPSAQSGALATLGRRPPRGSRASGSPSVYTPVDLISLPSPTIMHRSCS
jgi:hypothetical protein